ncbi:MAG TPA: polyhydroxyalkanoate synthesis repressor PhaR [Hyphomonadaceae bacterium]|nr:polyhydroxyalkanoate synthesis repressor PhaR [Hyphomonadaceae bacterium]
MTQSNGADGEKIIIKKYANRRLYDTSASAYVTLEHLSELTRQGKEFMVQDAKTGEDLTRAVLAQIIFEQENKKEGVLPVSFLRQLIQFYGDNFQTMLPAYLELSMKTFNQQQEKWREYMTTTVGEDKAKAFEDQVRKNMAMFEETMRFFTPFTAAMPTAPAAPRADEPAANGAARPAAPPTGLDAIRALQQQMMDMQKQLAQLATGAYTPSTDRKDDH